MFLLQKVHSWRIIIPAFLAPGLVQDGYPSGNWQSGWQLSGGLEDGDQEVWSRGVVMSGGCQVVWITPSVGNQSIL